MIGSPPSEGHRHDGRTKTRRRGGAGISGLTHAHVFRKNGCDVVVFEKSAEIAGIWALAGAHEEHRFDHLVVAVGQYSEGKRRPAFEGEETFRGVVGTERDVRSLEDFRGQRVAVVGFGKSALDIATLASGRGARVHHV